MPSTRRVPIRALHVTDFLLANRACCVSRAEITRRRISADDSPVRSADISRNFTCGTSTCRSIRSSNGPEMRPKIILNLPRCATAFRRHFPVGRRIHRRDQHELRRKSHRPGRARNRHIPFLQRLPHRFQNAAFELRQFIEKQHAVVRQRNFTRRRIHIPAQQSRIARRVMRRAKRSSRHQRLPRLQQARRCCESSSSPALLPT